MGCWSSTFQYLLIASSSTNNNIHKREWKAYQVCNIIKWIIVDVGTWNFIHFRIGIFTNLFQVLYKVHLRQDLFENYTMRERAVQCIAVVTKIKRMHLITIQNYVNFSIHWLHQVFSNRGVECFKPNFHSSSRNFNSANLSLLNLYRYLNAHYSNNILSVLLLFLEAVELTRELPIYNISISF